MKKSLATCASTLPENLSVVACAAARKIRSFLSMLLTPLAKTRRIKYSQINIKFSLDRANSADSGLQPLDGRVSQWYLLLRGAVLFQALVEGIPFSRCVD